MGKPRHLPFGYCIRDGKIAVNISESEIVKRIFALYINGSSYNEIAELMKNNKIIYGEETEWNKNIIGRILHNKKYIGIDVYPIIVEKVVFNKVSEKIKVKAPKKDFENNNILDLKSLMRCNNCGKRMNHQNGKWFCARCASVDKIKEETITAKIIEMINGLIENPYIVDIPLFKPYKPSMDIKRFENDIYRQLEKPECNEEYVKSLIRNLVDLKYRACDDGESGRQGQRIRELLMVNRCSNWVNTELFMDIADKIIVRENGDFFIVLKNGQKII